MAYHEAFWVADATIGPVVVLAQIVAVGRFVRLREEVGSDLPRLEEEHAAEYQPLVDDAWAHPDQRRGNLDAVLVELAVQRIGRTARRTVGLARTLARLAYMSVALSLISVGVAVYSLAWERDVLRTTVVANLVAASLVALLLETIWEVRLRLRVRAVGLAVTAELD